MTKRKVPEWIGKTPDTPTPPRVRLRVFEAHGGKCYLSGRKITPADNWELEHMLALALGGENRETNLAPALKDAHRKKTTEDRKIQAKNERVRRKHIGSDRKKSKFPTSRGGKFKQKIGGEIERREP